MGEEEDMIGLINHASTYLKDGKDEFLSEIPVESDSGWKILLIVPPNGANLVVKAGQYLKFEIMRPETPLLKPWDVIRPIEALPPNYIQMESLRMIFTPVLEKLKPEKLDSTVCWRRQTKLQRPDERGTESCFAGLHQWNQFHDKTGKNVSPVELTFNQFCALLGEFNRQTFERTGEAIIPSFAKNLMIDPKVPSSSKYFLHHGIYLSWSFTDHSRENKQIHFVIKCMDLILINNKRKRNSLLKRALCSLSNWSSTDDDGAPAGSFY